MNKRGAYFFVLDAIVAGIVIFTTMMFIFKTYTVPPEQDSSLRASEDFLRVLSTTTLRQYYSPVAQDLINRSNITNLDTTLMEQMVEFYFFKNQAGLVNLSKDTADSFVPAERSVMILINGSVAHNRTKTPLETSKLMISAKRMSYKLVNETVIYGPVWLEVKIWV